MTRHRINAARSGKSSDVSVTSTTSPHYPATLTAGELCAGTAPETERGMIISDVIKCSAVVSLSPACRELIRSAKFHINFYATQTRKPKARNDEQVRLHTVPGINVIQDYTAATVSTKSRTFGTKRSSFREVGDLP